MELALLIFTLLPLVSAQFGFFEQMFQGHSGHQQQQRSGANAWAAQSESGESPDSQLRYMGINRFLTYDGACSAMFKLFVSKNIGLCRDAVGVPMS